MRIAITLALMALLTGRALAGGTTTEVGKFTGSEGSIDFDVSRGQQYESQNGARITCFDKHVIQSVFLWGLDKKQLLKLRDLIDATIQELEKK